MDRSPAMIGDDTLLAAPASRCPIDHTARAATSDAARSTAGHATSSAARAAGAVRSANRLLTRRVARD